jgi:hypothetical protein
MEPALEGIEATSFPEPSVWPEWKPFTRGRYALTYDPYYTPPAPVTESENEEEEQEEEAPPPEAEKKPKPNEGRSPP